MSEKGIVTTESIKMTREHPAYFEGNTAVGNGNICTDAEARRFLKRTANDFTKLEKKFEKCR